MWSSASFCRANAKLFLSAKMLAGPNFNATRIRLNISLLPLFLLVASFSGRKLFRNDKVLKLKAAVSILTGVKGL
jgi:hypothetical protein